MNAWDAGGAGAVTRESDLHYIERAQQMRAMELDAEYIDAAAWAACAERNQRTDE